MKEDWALGLQFGWLILAYAIALITYQLRRRHRIICREQGWIINFSLPVLSIVSTSLYFLHSYSTPAMVWGLSTGVACGYYAWLIKRHRLHEEDCRFGPKRRRKRALARRTVPA